jgi:hypothetical protein
MAKFQIKTGCGQEVSENAGFFIEEKGTRS